MNIPAPELKTNEIYWQIQPSMVSGELLLPEIKLYSLLKQARDIPDAGESLSIQGLIYIVWGKIDKGSELCEAAIIESPYTPASWANYSVAVGRRSRFKQQNEILCRGMSFDLPLILKAALGQAIFWSDYPMGVDAMQRLDKLGVESPDKEAFKKMLSLIQDCPEESLHLTELARCVMDVAEEENIPPLRTHIETDFDGNHCFCFTVENVTNSKLYELNDRLAKLIVSRDLSSVGSVAMFDRRLKYAN